MATSLVPLPPLTFPANDPNTLGWTNAALGQPFIGADGSQWKYAGGAIWVRTDTTAAAGSYFGPHSMGVAYATGNMVSSGNALWIANRANTGVVPVEGLDWSKIATQGPQGVQGPPGVGGNLFALTSIYDATQYGVIGATAGDAAALSTLANTTMQPTGGTILIKRGIQVRIDTDVTLPRNVVMWYENGGGLSIDAARQVFHLAAIRAGLHQIFFGDGKRHVRLCTHTPGESRHASAVTTVYPEWWGAVGNGVAQDWIPVQIAMDVSAGAPFFDHTVSDFHTVSSATTTVITVTGSQWPVNALKNNSVEFLTGVHSGIERLVLSNTIDTITLAVALGSAPVAGDTFFLALSDPGPTSHRWDRATNDWSSSATYQLDHAVRCLNRSGMYIKTGGPESTTLQIVGGLNDQVATGGTTSTIVKAGAGWTVNQWRHFWLHIKADTGSGAKGQFFKILKNTADTITVQPKQAGEVMNPAPASGDTFTVMPETALDINGCFLGTIEGFSWSSGAESQQGVMFGVYYHRHHQYSSRGSSQCKFGIIRGSGPFYRGYQWGGKWYFDQHQEDNPIFDTLRADGNWHAGYTGYLYDAVVHFGNQQPSNNLNHGGSISGAGTLKLISTGHTNFWLRECHGAGHRYGLFIESNLIMGNAHILGLRLETTERLIHFPFHQYDSPGNLKIGTIWFTDMVARYDAAWDCAPLFVWQNGGGLSIDVMHVGLNTFTGISSTWMPTSTTSGTVNGLTRTGSGWVVDQFKAYMWYASSGTGRGQRTRILSNTSDTITFETPITIAPDSTTMWEAWMVPTICTSFSAGRVQINHATIGGGDFDQLIRGGDRVGFIDYQDIHPNMGTTRAKYHGPVDAQPAAAYYGSQHAGMAWMQAGNLPDCNLDRIGDHTLGASTLHSPLIRGRAIGVSPAWTLQKGGNHLGNALISITRAGATATATSAAPHGHVTGETVAIAGATQPEYNGSFVITVTGTSTFTYPVAGTPASPATGAPVVTGTTTHSYRVIARDGPLRALPSATITVTNAAKVLSPDSFVRFIPPTSHQPIWEYDMIKEVSPGVWQVFIDGERVGFNKRFEDNGQATKTYTVPTIDETGVLQCDRQFRHGATVAATTPGSVVRRMEVFDAAGVSLGFIPIYNTIT